MINSIGSDGKMSGQQTTDQMEVKENNKVQANRTAGSSNAAGQSSKGPVSAIIPSIMGTNNQTLAASMGSRSGSATSGTQSAAGRQHKLKQRFTVIKKLGKGTYGKVQLAINKETGQEVAIKTIKKTKIETEQDLERVRREIQIMSSIEHPHIIHIYEVFENKDKIVLIMQYAPGGELYEYVSQSKVLDEHEARRLFRQIATAIYYCHQNKICHRDLKLENILLDEKNNAKLADFGLSNVFDKNHQLKTFCGSPLYASPEIVRGSPYEGPEVDCWSLGVLLYTLVYGAMPFDGSNFKRLVKQISEASYYEPKQRSLASPLIGRLLCADPSRRASIRDICSDPWVNDHPAGNLSTSSPRVSPTPLTSSNTNNAPNGGQHPSLLKVAQDMANLTPVRLDILLSITRNSMDTKPEQQAQLAPNKTEASEEANAQMEVASREEVADELRKRENQQRDLQMKDRFGQNLMNIDENRPTSPVANYVVRDLEPEPASEQAKAREIDMQICSDEQSDGPKEQVEEVSTRPVGVDLEETHVERLVGQSSETEKLNETKADEEMSQVAQVADSSICEASTKMDIDRAQPELMGEDTEKCESSKMADIEDEPQSREVISEQENLDLVTELASKKSIPNETNQIGSTKDVQVAQGTDQIETKPQLSVANESSSGNGAQRANSADPKQIGSDDGTLEQSAVQVEGAAAEGKAKRVKKRIIVVKKKKKVVKKDDKDQESGGVEQGEDQQETKVTTATDSDKVPSGKSPAASSGPAASQPGRVRIPETFQPVDVPADEQLVQAKATRRQSALIADVSQKLLQLHQQDAAQTTSSSAIEMDQHQLASVRVSDTKSEFERRASLLANAIVGPTGVSPRALERISTPVLNLTAESSRDESFQSQLIESRLETSPMEPIELIVISAEPVTRQDPIEFQPLKVLASDTGQPTALGPQTPTNVQQSKHPLAGHEASARGVDRLSPELAARCENREGDERSDSVETIKADYLPEAGKSSKVRSSLQINLRPSNSSQVSVQQRDDASSSGQRMAACGVASFEPAPITRSYKKVTFTKDGICVTETGRIYSTRADDGTLRRVERKSKVTHYPSEAANNQASSEATTTHEEIVYESQSAMNDDEEVDRNEEEQHWRQSRSRQHPRPVDHPMAGHRLERLVMPTSQLDDVHDDHLNSTYFNQDDPFFQRNRTGSGSSCSSGSTDVFDDIFDTWTGAISMFNQGRHLAGLRGSLMKHRALGPSPSGLHSGHRSGRSSLLRHNSGTLCDRPQSSGPGESPFFLNRHHHHHHQQPFQRNTSTGQQQARCESADVTAHRDDLFGFATTSRPRPRRQRHSSSRLPSWATPNLGHGSGRMSAELSGYESDVPFGRPISATTLGGARGRFGSSNLFPRPSETLNQTSGHDDGAFFGADWPGSSLLERMELEHEMMRHQFAEKRQQMWKGSTPSLHDTTSSHFFQKANHQQQQQQTPIVRQTNSGASLRQSTPLDSAPIQRNTANLIQHLPPRQPARSTSKTSIITSQLAKIQLSHPNDQAQRHKSASFIELKRDSSSSSSRTQANQKHYQQQQHLQPQPQPQPQQQQQPQQPFESVASSSSQAPHWADSQITPTTCHSNASACFGAGQTTSNSGSMSHQQQPDVSETNSRIQNWLLQSSGNLSVSSGAKSTSSEATLPSSSGQSDMTTGVACSASSASQTLGRSVPISIASPQANARERNQTITRTLVSSHQLPPAPSNRSPYGGPSSELAKQVGASSGLGWPTAQPISMIVRSSSKKSLRELESPGHLERHRVHQTMDTIVSDDPTTQTSCTLVEHSHQSTATATTNHNEPFAFPNPLAMQQPQRQQQVVETRSVSTSSRQMFTQRTMSPLVGQDPTQQELWAPSGLRANQQQQPISSFNVAPTRPPIDDFSDFDSLIESAAELESRSSSSLLDQLRSRGYRSIMNQRNMTPVAAPQQQQQQQHPAQLNQQTTSTMAPTEPDAVTSSSTSMMTISSSGLGNGQGSFIEDQPGQQMQCPINRQQARGGDERELCEMPLEPEQFEQTTSNLGVIRQKSPEQIACLGPIFGAKLEDGASNTHQLASNGLQMQQPTQVANNIVPEPKSNLTNQTPSEQDEDLDEDVREAKANVREYLDRIKETEKFIKSMQEEEERCQRQRQESFLFNNLLLSTKLNAIKTQNGSQKFDWTNTTNNPLISSEDCLGESHSAPVMMTPNSGRLQMTNRMVSRQNETRHLNELANLSKTTSNFGDNPIECPLSSGRFGTGRALSLEPSFSCFNANLFSPSNFTGSSLLSAQRGPTEAFNGDPLEPVQPIGSIHQNSFMQPARNNWHRSKSQLSDQFHFDHSTSTSLAPNGRRPLSASIDRYSNTSNAYFPLRNRHRSSTRYQPPISTNTHANVFHDDLDDEPMVMMSEYKSSFREPNLRPRHHSLAPTSPNRSSRARATSPLLSLNTIGTISAGLKDENDDHLDDEHELNVYRPSRYVPKVLSNAKSSLRSSSVTREDHLSGRLKDKLTSGQASCQTQVVTRRSSMQTPLTNANLLADLDQVNCDSDEASDWLARRRSWATSEPSKLNATNGSEGGGGGSSRLSELEQRLQANKRRREELLQGINSVDKQGPRRRVGEFVANGQNGKDDEEDQLEQSCGFERPSRPVERESSAQQKCSSRESSLTNCTDQQPERNKTPLGTTSTRHRASRLESMEARIRRKSYCVRVRSPKRSVA